MVPKVNANLGGMFVENSTNNLFSWAKREGAKNDKLAETTSTWHYLFSTGQYSSHF